LRSFLRDGIAVRFRTQGRSMFPAIAEGEMVEVAPAGQVCRGDIVLAETKDGLRVHRVVRLVGDAVATRGDCCFDEELASFALGRVSLVRGEQSRPVATQAPGSVIRRWVAKCRGYF
jgi:hypothetical protein